MYNPIPHTEQARTHVCNGGSSAWVDSTPVYETLITVDVWEVVSISLQLQAGGVRGERGKSLIVTVCACDHVH